MSERLNSSPDSRNGEKDTKTRAELGEEFLRTIADFPPDYHFSGEQKFLFSTVSRASTESDFPSTGPETSAAVFSTFGLEYDGKLFPYTEEYKALAHRTVLKTLLDGAESREDVIARFESENEFWQEPLTKLYRKLARPSAELEFRAARAENGINLRQILRSEHEELEGKVILEEAVRQGKLSDEFAEKYSGYYERRDELIITFRKRVRELCVKKMKFGFAVKYARDAKDVLERYVSSIGVAEGQKFIDRSNGEDRHIGNSILRKLTSEDSKELKEYRVDPSQEKELIFDQLERNGLAEDPELLKILSDIEKTTTEYYGELCPQYIRIREIIKHPKAGEYSKLLSEDLALREAHESFVEHRSFEIANDRLVAFKNRVAETFFPDTKIQDIYFVPTGAAIMTTEGHFQTATFSPLSERILALFSDESAEAVWRKKWTEHAHEYDVPVRGALEVDYEKNARSFTDDFDERMKSLAERFQLDFPETLSLFSGRVHESLQPSDSELLEYLMPKVGNFIKGVNLSHEKNLSLKSVRLEILGFLSGDKNVENSSLFADDQKLKIRALERLIIDAGPEKYDKVAARLVPELGISVFHGLDADARAEFSRLVGSRADVSRTEFYRVYRKSISDPKARRDLAERTIFLAEFSKYLKGESSLATTEFFDKIKKKPALPK